MTSERWPEVKLLLDRALDLQHHERLEFIEAQCGEDAELRSELEAYLDLEGEVEDIFELPLLDLIAGRPPEFRAGERIASFELEGEIARGGMGVVYHASRVEGGFEQDVAIKVLKRGFDTGDFVRRFRTERQILADLVHPNIVRLLDGGATEDGLPYLVMEAVEGTRLSAYCAEARPDLDRRLDIFLKICDAVHVAHQHMVVHCDLKPSNILVTPEGEPKLLDFGIAKVLQQGAEGATHSINLRIGTPPYASPEQMAGKAITTANDVYSLGGILFLLLTGRPPKPAGDPDEPPQVPSRVLAQDLRAPADQRGACEGLTVQAVRGDLDAITLRAMTWDPEQRYTSAAALAADIRRHRAQLPVEAQPYSWQYILGRFVRRHRRALTVSTVFLLVLGIAAAIGVFFQVQAQVQGTRARDLRDAYLEVIEVFDPTSNESKAEAARTAMERALASERFGDELDQATIYDRLGRSFQRLELYPEAQSLLERSLALRQGSPRTPPADLLASLNNLGSLLFSRGQKQAADELFERAEEVYRRHPDVDLATVNDLTSNLATLREREGDLEAAEILFRRVLDERNTLYGPRSLEVARALNNLGKVLYTRGNLDEAEPLYLESIAIRHELLDPDKPQLAIVLMNLAALYDARGDGDKAVATYRQALNIRLQTFNPDDPQVARTQASLGYALLGRAATGDLEEAQRRLEEAWQTHLDKSGPDHENTLVIQRNLAAVLLERGNVERAEGLIRDVVDRSEALGDRSEWRVADARSVLGACLLAQGRYAEARPLLEGAAEIIANVRGEASRPAREARERWQAWRAATSAG